MGPATSRRLLLVGVSFASLLITLAATPRVARAVDEFATPPPRPVLKAKTLTSAQVPEIRALRAPDLVGQPVSAARAMLERQHLSLGRETAQVTSERPAGVVTGQDPKPGTVLQAGAVVNVWYATPPRVATVPGNRIPSTDGGSQQPVLVAVPDLTGQTPRDAARL